jgi:glycosyltransferase involved in cell wall biosynthesis
MRKKKILLVVGNNLMHGTERYAIDLARYLDPGLFEVTVATPEKGSLSELLQKYGIREFVYNNGKFNYFTFRGAVNLARHILKKRYDVIHSNFSIVPNMIGRILGVKLNIEIKHGILIPYETLNNLTRKQKFHEKMKEFFVDKFIAISENDKDKMIHYFGIDSSKIEVIYNGLDTEKVIQYRKSPDIKKESEKKSILIGTIGRFSYQKAQNVLIEAFEKVMDRCQNLKLIIIGAGENEKEMNDIVKNRNLSDRVTIEKYKEEIYDYIRKFDIFVLTSRFEGVPYVLLESMLIGTPIVSTRVGGIDNVLRDNYSAFLVDRENAGQVSEAINKLVKDPTLRVKLAANALSEVEKYDVRIMAENVKKLYLKYL